MFSCEFNEIFENNYFYRTPSVVAYREILFSFDLHVFVFHNSLDLWVTEVYLELCQTFKMKRFAEKING